MRGSNGSNGSEAEVVGRSEVKIGLASVTDPRTTFGWLKGIFGPSSAQLTAHCRNTPTTVSRYVDATVGQLIKGWYFLGRQSAEIGTASAAYSARQFFWDQNTLEGTMCVCKTFWQNGRRDMCAIVEGAARVCQQNIQRRCAVGSEAWYCPQLAC